MFGVPLYPTHIGQQRSHVPNIRIKKGVGWKETHACLCDPPKFHLVLICPLPGVPHCSLLRIRCCSLPLTLVAPSLTVSHPSAPAP